MGIRKRTRRAQIRSPYRQSPWLIALAIVVAVGAAVLVAAALISF
jgi:hypothetical protein